MAMRKVKVYYWDFWGHDAKGTAAHFQKHLNEFLNANNLEGCETGVQTNMVGHCSSWCKTPPELEETIERSLRPRRALWGEMEEPEVYEV